MRGTSVAVVPLHRPQAHACAKEEPVMATQRDILSLLHEDHEKVAILLEELTSIRDDDAQQRRQPFDELKRNLLSHAEAEEAVFYDALLDSEETEDLAQDAIDEHTVVKQPLGELDAIGFDSDDGSGKPVGVMRTSSITSRGGGRDVRRSTRLVRRR
jgi:hypothetical protein